MKEMKLTWKTLLKAVYRTPVSIPSSMLNFARTIRLPSGIPLANLPQFVNTLVFLLGLTLILLSSNYAWIEVPDFLQQTPDGYNVITLDSSTTPVYKILVGFVTGVSMLGFALKVFENKHLLKIMSSLFALLLMFPATILHFSPDVASLGGWIENQHYNLTWLGGDIFTVQEEAFFDQKQNLYIVDPPAQSGVVSIPHSLPFLLQISLMSEYVSWLGYTESFTLFVSKGWILACSGTLLLTMSMIRRTWNFDINLLRICLKSFTAVMAVCITLALLPIVLAAYDISKSERAMNDQDYAKAYEHLNKACRTMPILAEESVMITQRSLLASRLNISSPESWHYEATILEQAGFKAAAEQIYLDIIKSQETPEPLRREARRGILRQAIHRINSQQFERAYILLRNLMLQKPCELKANYALQFTCLQTGRFNEVAKLDRMLTATYSKIKTLNKKALLAFSHDNHALANYQLDDLSGALEQKQRSIRP